MDETSIRIENTAFITRIKNKVSTEKDDYKKLIKTIKGAGIQHIYVLWGEAHNVDENGITYIQSDDPTGPTSINRAIKKLEEVGATAFIVASKEVVITKSAVKTLLKRLDDNLVVGYKFKHSELHLNKELNAYYANENLLAYKVPWNTCALWNFKKFQKHIKKFDEISARSPYPEVCVSIDGQSYKEPHQGMEDGLAVAQGAQYGLRYRLLDDELLWEVENPLKHRRKLARKDPVMKDLMACRNYSAQDLLDASSKQK